MKCPSRLFPLLIVLFVASRVRAATPKPFDSHGKPDDELVAAERAASESGKSILLDFGANWCAPCVDLDKAFHDDLRLRALLERKFIVVHVTSGRFSVNKAAMKIYAKYPKFKTIPHLMVLSADGTLVRDADMERMVSIAKAESDSNWVLVRFLEGTDEWASPPK